jgi:hypothetical protein
LPGSPNRENKTATKVELGDDMLEEMRAALRRSDTTAVDFLGCVALAVLLIAGLHLPYL